MNKKRGVIAINKEKRVVDLAKIKQLMVSLVLKGTPILRKELIAQIMITLNLSKRTSQEYMDALMLTNAWEFKDGKLAETKV